MIKKRLTGNSGSASLEASLAVPIFLLAMVYLFQIFQCVLAEALVYEAAAETAEYLAEFSYTELCSLPVAYLKFSGYVDEDDTVERYIKGGTSGVSFLGSIMLDEDDCVVLRVSYETKYAGERTFTIRKRAYTGAKTSSGEEGDGQEDDSYVYVTDNQSVYHLSQSCTHLSLSIHTASAMHAREQGYEPCGFCGDDAGGTVYITDEGDCYHSNRCCSGLKRTIYRKKKSEVTGLGPCSRCGDQNE